MDANYVVHLLRQFAGYLEHPDLERNSLSEIEDLGQEAVPRLVEALSQEDAHVRRTAICALGYLYSTDGDPFDLAPAIPHLERIAQSDSNPLVRLHAAEVLWTICQHKTAVRVLVGGLHDNMVEARRYAAERLGVLGTEVVEAIQPLIDTLDDPDVLDHND